MFDASAGLGFTDTDPGHSNVLHRPAGNVWERRCAVAALGFSAQFLL